MKEIDSMYPDDKNLCYQLIHSQLRALLENEFNVISNLSNSSALLNLALKDINWVGFYFLRENELILGPFQGKPACFHIPVGKGVCGTAVSKNRTQLVADVHEFQGHIACDSASRSEIVVPIRICDQIVGVLDIDSPSIGRFDLADCEGLEEVVHILEAGCNWSVAM